MIRQRAQMLTLLVACADALVLVVAFGLAYGLRGLLPADEYGVMKPLADYLPVLIVSLPIWLGLMGYVGLYGSFRTQPSWAEPLGLVQVAAIATLLTAAMGFALKLQFVSRLLIAIFGIVAFVLLLAARTTLRQLARRARRQGLNTRNVIIVGSGPRLRAVAKVLEENPEWGLRLIGIVFDFDGEVRPVNLGLPVLGRASQLREILQNTVVDEIIFTVSRRKLEVLEDIFLYCEELGIRTHVAVNFFPQLIAKMHLDSLANVPILTFSTTPYNEILLVIKRAFDVIASAALIALLSPVLAVTAIAVKLTSPGPLLFRQTRIGLNGRQFMLYKFRSMVQDAEDRKAELMHLNEMNGPVFKIKNDPRLTPIGAFIRRFSLDELPQLFNVLEGTMSLVGPRPPVPDEVVQYKSWQRRRLSMKPGITCLWQVNGRNGVVDFDKWMELDLQYIDNWSLKLDLQIFAKTIPVVLLGRGAA